MFQETDGAMKHKLAWHNTKIVSKWHYVINSKLYSQL
jgi:hypothetical protein